MGSEQYRKEVFKFGHGHNLQTVDAPTDLWEGSKGLYPFQTSPVKLYASSSSASDVGKPLTIEGLDENGIIKRATVILNGQTQVAISGLWWRQYRGFNSDSGTLFVGDIYVAEQDTLTGGIPNTASKIKLQVEPLFQQTQMLVYTTPRDWEAKFKCMFISLVPKNTNVVYARVGLYTRQPGQSWLNKLYFGLITSGDSAIVLPHLENMGTIQPFTDIVVRAIDISTNGMEVTGAFAMDFTRKVSI